MENGLSYLEWASEKGILGLIGLIVSLAGFAFAYFQLIRTQTSANAAKDAAERALDSISKMDGLMEFATATQAVNELKNAIRQQRLDDAPNLFNQIRRSMALCLQSTLLSDPSDRKIVEQAQVFFRELEVHLLDTPQDKFAKDSSLVTSRLITITDAFYEVQARRKTDSKNAA